MAASGIIFQILSLIGALGLFLYGMKMMSQSLQKFAGRRMRIILTRITANHFRAISAGFLVTATIQSSSATTVMLVSFVNAGLVSFYESLGIIFGANIGTTVKAWLISLLGFGSTFDMTMIILPLVAFSLPLFFSDKAINKARVEFIMGFVILFLGLYFFKLGVPVIDETSPIFGHFHSLSDPTRGNTLLFIGLGLVITAIFQSSSATIALTMVMASQGWLTFGNALAMVLGENIGTTVTANIAAIVANRTAKRTALAHTLFNVIGVLWVLPFFNIIVDAVHSLTKDLMVVTPQDDASLIPFGMSIFHTTFNVFNTILLSILLHQFETINKWIIPNKGSLQGIQSPMIIDSNLVSTPELSLLQVRREMSGLGKNIEGLFQMIPDLLVEKNEKKFQKRLSQLHERKSEIGNNALYLMKYLVRTLEDELSEQGSRRIKAMLMILDHLKNIADQIIKMSVVVQQKNEAKAWFTQDMRDNLEKEFILTGKAFDVMNLNLKLEYQDINVEDVNSIEDQINFLRNQLRNGFRLANDIEIIPDQAMISYNDLLGISEKIVDYIISVNRELYETKPME